MVKRETIVKSKYEDKNDSRTEEMPFLFKPMEIKLNGTMNLSTDGTGTINAFFSGPEDLPNGKPSSFGCPPIKGYVDCKLTLVKTKAN